MCLKGLKFKEGVSKRYATLETTLKNVKDIHHSCLALRSDMSVVKQHKKIQRKRKKLRQEKLQTAAKGRGRKLKCYEFPEFVRYIKFAAGDRALHGGGGLQADPRLVDTIRYSRQLAKQLL